MWKDHLKEISEEKAQYHESINNGATGEILSIFKKEAYSTFGHELPTDYLEFLKSVNGIEFNGFVIYGVDQYIAGSDWNQHITGFIELNLIWRENEWEKDMLFMGESNISWYAYDVDNKVFYEMDNPSGREVGMFEDFYKLLDKVLSDSLL